MDYKYTTPIAEDINVMFIAQGSSLLRPLCDLFCQILTHICIQLYTIGIQQSPVRKFGLELKAEEISYTFKPRELDARTKSQHKDRKNIVRKFCKFQIFLNSPNKSKFHSRLN
jgi:hypothetical protein